MADLPESLDDVRSEIDAADDKIIELLNRRARLAQRIGELKGRDGRPFFTPERERSVFERLREANAGPLRSDQLRSIYREIISAARALEQPLRSAYWGPPGTFSNLASLQAFGGSSEHVPVDSIAEVFAAVESGDCAYGVAPIENSLAGVVPETLDAFFTTNVRICAESYLQIDHYLASLAPSLEAVKRIYAGPQPFGQCRRWIREKLAGVEVVEVAPTAKAAERAAADPEGAAIVNQLGAQFYGLPILASKIQDNPQNRTRFVVVGFNEPVQTGRDKTSLMFNLRNTPGALYKALGALYEHGVNLQMIESRPAQNSAFEYLFFVDCLGHQKDAAMAAAISDLRGLALETIVLGSYPAAE